MKKTLGVIGFLVFIVIPISAWGEPPSIYVAGTHLNLGMSKSEVEKQIEAAGYRLKDSIITSKTGPPFDTPGTVSFNKDEKLRWVWKNWGTFHGDRAVSLGKAFFLH